MPLWNVESTQEHQMFPVLQEEALDVATPDRLMRGLLRGLDFGPDIRVAGTGLVVSVVEPTRDHAERDGQQSSADGQREASPEGAVGELFYISIYCCEGDPGGAYCPIEEGGRATASGVSVAPWVAACSNHWPFGTVFIIAPGSANERRVVCQDRGSGVLTRTHLDVWFYACGDQEDPAPGTGWAWLQSVGTQVEVEVVR